jgi:hypothetical protein
LRLIPWPLTPALSPQAGRGGKSPPAEGGQARIVRDEGVRPVRPRRAVPAREHREALGRVGDRHLRPQLVEAEPLGEVGREGLEHVEVVAALLRRLVDDEVEQDLALRGEQRAEPGPPGRDPVHVAGQEAVEEALGLVSADGHDAPVRQVTDRHSRLRLARTCALT